MCPKGYTVHGARIFNYALSWSSAESSVDAGIPQAEARGPGGYAPVFDSHTFFRTYTRLVATLPPNDRKFGSSTRAFERGLQAKSGTQQL